MSADNHERWLITYADLITLLMIFFVVLYAMSQLDVKKYDVLAQSLQFEFRQADSVLEQGSGVLGAQDSAKAPEAGADEDGKKELDAASGQGVDGNKEHAAAALSREHQQEQELQHLLKFIQSYIGEHGLEKQVFVDDRPRGVTIRLSDRFLFDLGRADLKTEAEPILVKLSSLFKDIGHTISIEGHTDNLPIPPGGEFRDNWGLSAARSLSVLRYFIDTSKLAPSQFEIAGYGDTRPVEPNTTEAGRQKNRRVEITVLRAAGGK